MIVSASGVGEAEALSHTRALLRRSWGRYVLTLCALIAVPLVIARVMLDSYLFPYDPTLFLIALALLSVAALRAGFSQGILAHHRRMVERCLCTPSCFSCGYLLTGLPIDESEGATRITCPECRTLSPTALSGTSLANTSDLERLDRITDRARRVLNLAQKEARRLNHEYVGTEHLLLAMAKDGGGLAAIVLRNHRLSLDAIQRSIEARIRPGTETVPIGRLPLTPRAHSVLRFASEEAESLGHDYIGTEHILLGLVRKGDGLAGQVLQSAGLDLRNLRASLEEFLVVRRVRR